MVLGRVFHIGVDAVLVSAFLAGLSRSSGLRVNTAKIESPDVRSAVEKYLNVGEWAMDQSVAFFGTSSYFERKR